MFFRRLFIVLVTLSLGISGIIRAQDTPPQSDSPPVVDAPSDTPTEIPTEVVTDVPTDVPADVPTEAATDIPTEVATDVPTDVPTEVVTDVPTEVATDVPTEAATEAPTLEPTVEANLPPQFSLDGSTALEAIAGVQTTFTLAVADEDGLVTVGRADTTSVAAITVTQATEAVVADPRFYTAVTVDYTAPADFSGADSFTLVAVDAANLSTTLTLPVNVAQPPPVTLEPTTEPTEIPDQIRVINYNPSASEESIQAMLSALGAVEVSRIPQIGAMKVKISQALSTTTAAISALSVDAKAMAAGVSSVEQDMEYRIDALPNDPYYPIGAATLDKQWGLDNATSPYASIYANNAWGISVKDGSGIIVAVIDTGIDTTHPDLVGKILPGYDFVNDDANTDDDNSHGTHVSGVIAANTNNAKGIAGIAFNAKLLPVKVCNYAGGCDTYTIAQGIVFAVDKGARVANMSLGGGTISTTIQAAVQYALSRNMTIVAAAGNTGGTTYQYPASFDGVISVAAHDINGNHASFSTANNRVTVSAPGVQIVSSVPPEFDTCDGLQDGYSRITAFPGCGDWSGTSMASPHVTGIVALMLSDNVVTNPAQAKTALICSAWDAGPAAATAGYDNQFGYGYVQADWAQNWRANSSTCHMNAPNDLYQNATVVTAVPYVTTQAIDSRATSLSASDPGGCTAPNQSVWYKFTPTVSDNYQIATLGSSYNTALSVWQMPEEGNFSTNFIACNDNTLGSQSLLNANLTAGQVYYIEVDSVGTANDAVLNLDVRRSLIANNVDAQETSPSILYTGSWLQTVVTGAAGGSVKSTGDNNALAAFTFRGNYFYLYRSVGPTNGNLEIYIDGILRTTVDNRGPVVKRNQGWFVDANYGGTAGTWHQVIVRRAAAGPAGPVDIDRITTFENVNVPTTAITAITDDGLGSQSACATKKFCFWPSTPGAFVVLTVPGANLGKVTRTTLTGASIYFRATGTAITIFRNTGPGYGSMTILIDGVSYGSYSNNSPVSRVKVPLTISGLGAYTHVVQVSNDAGSVLDFDAAQAASPAALAATTVQTNENAATLIYSGFWTSLTTPGALGNTTRQTTDPGASLYFRYTGNWFCINYTERSGVTGSVDIYEDGYYIDTLSTSGIGTSFNNFWCDPYIRSDRTHTVQIYYSTGTFELDGLWAKRQTVITPSMGLIQETNAALTYWGTWGPYTQHSTGGYTFQGGSAKTTMNDGDGLYFYANGTGFILYTSLATWNSGWQVFVDGSLTPLNITYNGSTYNWIDAHDSRFRPFAIGITGLSPGVHFIELVKWDDGAGIDWVDFDAVRVFP